MFSSVLDFAAKVVGSAAYSKFEEFPAMSAISMTIPVMPVLGAYGFPRSVLEPSEASKQASKQAFIFK